MNRFHNLSIRHKLMLIIMVISTVSLLIASAALITTDRVKIREAVGSNLTTMTEVLAAQNSAAILFKDVTAAEETLRPPPVPPLPRAPPRPRSRALRRRLPLRRATPLAPRPQVRLRPPARRAPMVPR